MDNLSSTNSVTKAETEIESDGKTDVTATASYEKPKVVRVRRVLAAGGHTV